MTAYAMGDGGHAERQRKVDEEFPDLADLAFLLDSRWRIPGTNIRFGADAVAGLLRASAMRLPA